MADRKAGCQRFRLGGDQPVEGQNADGTLAAEGFQVLNDGKTVIFTGRAYMKIYPKAQANGASGGTAQ